MDAARVDVWLWAVRAFATRSSATDACRGGHVRVNGSPAKAAARIHVGDQVAVRAHGRDRVLEVVKVLDKRVGAPAATECVIDRTPAPPEDEERVPDRDRGTGRPTKRDRRRLDRLRR